MDIMNLNNLFLTTAQGDLLQSQDQIILRNMVHLSLLKCGNVEMESMIDQGDLSKILGIHWEKSILFVKNIFSAEPRILQGTKKLFTKERGDPIQRIPRKKANFEKLIMGSDTTEFVNKVKNQVRIRQKRMSTNVAEDCTETFNNMGNVHGYNIECSNIHGKELFHDAKCCAEWRENNIETNVRCYCDDNQQ